MDANDQEIDEGLQQQPYSNSKFRVQEDPNQFIDMRIDYYVDIIARILHQNIMKFDQLRYYLLGFVDKLKDLRPNILQEPYWEVLRFYDAKFIARTMFITLDSGLVIVNNEEELLPSQQSLNA